MPEYRRAYVPGGTFFLTLVTFERRPTFSDPENVSRLRSAISVVQRSRPFDIDAGVVLPDHLHLIVTLPENDPTLSARVGQIKLKFTQSLPSYVIGPTASRADHREADVWQRRFWEHAVRDQDDRNRLMDYVHYNPVKHGYAECPHGWEYSSFHRAVGRGQYEPDWCCGCDGKRFVAPKFDDLADVVGE